MRGRVAQRRRWPDGLQAAVEAKEGLNTTDEGEVLVAALFRTPEKVRAFKERADHLDLPDSLGTIDDADGLRRHALVAQQAGADYAVIDPESGITEAIPMEELIR